VKEFLRLTLPNDSLNLRRCLQLLVPNDFNIRDFEYLMKNLVIARESFNGESCDMTASEAKK
jgi:hypothetical protein